MTDLLPASAPAHIVSDDNILGGQPVVSGTRIPAETILAYLRDGHTPAQIREDYPSLPTDGIGAVERWALSAYGPDWRAAPRLPADA